MLWRPYWRASSCTPLMHRRWYVDSSCDCPVITFTAHGLFYSYTCYRATHEICQLILCLRQHVCMLQALVMPVLVRGLRDRSAEAKRRAALIIGSMCSMAADARDLVPYLDGIMPGLKASVHTA
jgi:hypothetical protein